MTTVHGDNIFPIEVDGTFDDCQNIVKSILVDRDFSEEFSIAAVNSINWSRVMIQIVYYFYTLINNNISEDEIINFSVPTGNFGDIYAGYVGIKMGLPVNKLIIATNENDILDRFINSGSYSIEGVTKTTSPSMDIAIASNFERLLFDLLQRSSVMTSEKMNELKNNRSFSVTKEQSNLVKKTFSSKKINQNEVNDLIKETYKEFNYIMDPHTAIGLGASRVLNERSDNNFILGTAHPIKFSDTVEKAIGHPMQSTNEFFEMYKNEEKFYSFMNSAEEVRKVIKDNYSK